MEDGSEDIFGDKPSVRQGPLGTEHLNYSNKLFFYEKNLLN
jgi:hypothetical protein